MRLKTLSGGIVLLPFLSKTLAQIGVDNVDIATQTDTQILVDTQYLTQDPSLFIGTIGVNTEYLTEDNGNTKWIGVNTDYMTQITQTSDVSGTPVTSTAPVKATIVGTPPENGVATEDFSIVITPSFQAEIESIKAEFCPLKKRALTCGPEFARKISAAFDIYAAAQGAKIAAGGGILAVAGMFAAQMQKIAEGGQKTPLKIDISKDNFNNARPVGTVVTIITVTRTATSASSSSTGGAGGGGGKGGDTQPTETAIPECWLYRGSEPDLSNIDTDDNDDGDDPPTKEKRLAGRVVYNDLSMTSMNPASILKRKGPPRKLTKLGFCPQDISINTEDTRFNVNQVAGGSIPEDQFWFVPQPASDDIKLCRVYTLQRVNLGSGKASFPPGYTQKGNGPKLSVDHAFEVNMLEGFFKAVFKDSSDKRCLPFLDMYNKDNAEGKDYPRLQSLFYLGPNKNNKAFVGLDQKINSVKGSLWNPGLPDIQRIREAERDNITPEDAADKNLNLWNDIAMAWGVLKQPAAAAQFKKVNTDMYRAFRQIDKDQACLSDDDLKGAGDGLLKATWASQYEGYIKSFVANQKADVVKYVASITSAIAAAPSATENPDKSKNKYGHAFQALEKKFPEGYYDLDEAAIFDFSGDPLPFKRDNPIGLPACSITSSPSTTALPSDLPKLSNSCVTSSEFNCQWIYKPATNTADCPTTTVTTMSPSCTPDWKPPFVAPKVPPHPDGLRDKYTKQCIDHNMAGINSMDRTFALQAIYDGWMAMQSRPVPPAPSGGMGVNFLNTSWAGSDEYVHMVMSWSDDQSGCNNKPMDPNGDHHIGLVWPDYRDAMSFIIENCDTDTVTAKWGGALLWNTQYGCLQFEMWRQDPIPK